MWQDRHRRVRAGEVIPNDCVKTIWSIETAAVKAINAVDRQFVQAGDALIELDVQPLRVVVKTPPSRSKYFLKERTSGSSIRGRTPM